MTLAMDNILGTFIADEGNLKLQGLAGLDWLLQVVSHLSTTCIPRLIRF